MLNIKIIKIAQLSYLNMLPFNQMETPQIVYANSPREVTRFAKENKIDAGPIPIVDCWELKDLFEPLSNFCISVKKEAKSVFLFSKYPIASLEGHTIGVTNQTSTSVKLLNLLLKEKYKIKVIYQEGFHETQSAQLVIGDEALLKKESFSKVFPSVYDLAQEWYQWTKHPFVFARWMVRKTLSESHKNKLIQNLEESLQRYQESKREIIAKSFSRWNLAPEKIESYLNNFIYKMGDSEKKSEILFQNWLKKG